MRPESLKLLIEAARINPHVTVSALAADDKYGEALVDVYAEDTTKGAKAFSPESWDSLLEEVDNDPRTLAQYMDTPAVRAFIRAQEAAHVSA